MVYTRILFNNIKNSTPAFIKTIAYSATVKPVLGRKPQVAFKMTRDPKYIRMMKWIHRNIMMKTVNYQIFFFAVTYGITAVFFYPGLWIYQSNNRHRQLDFVLAKENEYKRLKAAEEEEDEEDGAAADEDDE